MVEISEARDFKSGWIVRGLRDSTSFFRNVHLVLPPGSLLVFEEGSIAKDVRHFMEVNAVAPQARLAHGTWWPRSRMHWMVPAAGTLAALAELSLNHAEPEICDHLYAVRDGRLVLAWHDAFDDPLLISSEVSAEAVSAFGSAVRLQPEPWQAA